MEETWWVEESQLDEDQRKVAELPPHGSYLIKGPPGSGKTNLLLLRAKYLTMRGASNLTVIVFSRPLCEFMRSGSGHYNFDPKKIVTSTQFAQSVLAERGRSVPRGTMDFTEYRVELLKRLQEELASGKIPVIHDTILLDESQDYLPEEIELYKAFAKDLFAVADSRQKIYDLADALPTLEKLVDKTVELRFHYRNGIEICRLADEVGARITGGYDPITPTSNYPEKQLRSKFEAHCCPLDEQATKIAEALKLQRRTFPAALLGVICPRLAEVREIAAKLEGLGLGPELTVQTFEDGYQPMDPTRPIWISTIHGAKGLEFRTLHVAGLEYIRNMGGQQKKLAFTAITRAKTRLDLYYQEPLPGYLAGAIDSLTPIKKVPSLKDAFQS
jgi:superfamily I DNA/RNA helicase